MPRPARPACFVIDEIRLVGAEAEDFAWLTTAATPFLHRCVGVEGLRQVAAALDGKLIDRGFATSRITLPEQNLRKGVLFGQLHVGRVAEVRMVRAPGDEAGDAPVPDTGWGTWRNAFPLQAGDVLNVRHLEQGVEQMTRLPSQWVTTEIAPGPEPGSSVVYIQRRPTGLAERLRGGGTLDKSGGALLGRTQLSGFLSLDNPLGLNDVFNLHVGGSVEQSDPDRRSQSVGVNYNVPWDYATFSMAHAYSRYAQRVQGTTVRFISSGRSEATEAKLHYTARRTRSAKFGVYASVFSRRARSFLDDVEIIVQRRRTTHVAGGITYRQLFGHADVDFDLSYRRGVAWNGAEDDFSAAEAAGLTLRPRMWSIAAVYRQPFSLGGRVFHYSASLTGQRTRDTMLTLDQFAIGNRGSVRGFDGDGVLLAESGFYWRSELTYPLRTPLGVSTQVYAGVDFGRVWGASDDILPGNALAGAAVGARGQWKSLHLDAAVATPVRRPAQFETQQWNPYLSLTYVF